MPRTLNPEPDSISRRAASSAPWSNVSGLNPASSSPTRPAARAGSFLGAYDFITNSDNFKLDKKQKAFLKHEAFHGNEIVANTRRLCLMNMFLHNIGEIEGGAPISPNDSLVADAGKRFDYVLANPPFGKKSSMSFTNEEGEQEKDDLNLQPAGLLGDHLKQTTQFRAAHSHDAQNHWPCCRCRAGQRAV